MHRLIAALAAATAMALSLVGPVAANDGQSAPTATARVATISEGADPTPGLPRIESEPGLHLPPLGAESPPQRRLQLNHIPFDIGRDLTVAPASLWDRIRNGFGMPPARDGLVRDWESWYSSRPEHLQRVVERSQRYLFFIVDEIEKRGMPSEIALLPIIESAFNPNAYSRAHASGMWQFIPSTGKLYGLQQNWWQDERRDVLAATRAALDYLEKLYEMFGSWDLALAGYNWGEGAVSRAQQRNEARGLRTDYASLDMPAETRNYVPKLMAVRNIIAAPESFGMRLAHIPNAPYFETVTLDRHIDVRVAARLANLTVEEFTALNPAHNRPVIRADNRTQILIPADRAQAFRERLASHDRPLATWETYTMGRGERLEQIAARFGISVDQLRSVNGIPARLRNAGGLTLLVPSRDGEPTLQANVAAPTPAAFEPEPARRTHVVRAGETLAALASRYGVSVQQLVTLNRLSGQKLTAGQRLQVPGASATAQSASGGTRTTAASPAARPAARQPAAQQAKAGARPAQARQQAKAPAKAAPRVRVATTGGGRS